MDQTLTFVVTEAEQDRRLDLFLAGRAADLSRARIQVLIQQGLILVDGQAVKASRRLKSGQTVRLIVPAPVTSQLIPEPEVDFDLLYQDADLVVIDKPAGLVVHPATGHRTGTLVHGLLAACPDLKGVGGELRPGLVHRLDKDTSGVMVVAKSEPALKGLVADFKSRGVQKNYLALCLGRPRLDRGQIDAPIGRHPLRRQEMSVRSRRGREALTKYEVLRQYEVGVSLLRLELLTGRTHQIRVHLASIGHPVLGDKVYGRGLAGLNRALAWRGLVKRQMLHAQRLGFDHPITRIRLEFTAPLPGDMNEVIEVLDKQEGIHKPGRNIHLTKGGRWVI
ncbi:MAG: RluA family pseudouridine synthase [Thermodesulfobacteriota bacterium]